MKTSRFALSTFLLAACADVEDAHDHAHEHELITTVVLTFTPLAGGTPLTFRWADPEGDGSPEIDDISLADADDYDLSISFLDEQEDPAEDLSAEIADEADEHQVFLTGTGVEGPATPENAAAIVAHAYADEDADGRPLGLQSTIATRGVGSGTLVVTLQHLPAQDGSPQKVDDLAEEVAASGLGALPGEADVSVTFPLIVQ